MSRFSLVNTLSPGDKILAVVTGFFGQRYSDMAKALLIDVEELHFEWGRDIDIGIRYNEVEIIE